MNTSNPTALSPGSTPLLVLPGGWGWAGLLRFGIAISIAVHAVSSGPDAVTGARTNARPISLLLAVALLALSVAQGTSRLRSSRRAAVLFLAADALAVLAALALFPSPRRYLPALLVVVHAEAGVVLGLPDGAVAWLLTTGGYLVVEGLSGPGGSVVNGAEMAVRLGVGLLLTLVGGVMSEELSGERARQFEEQGRELTEVREDAARYRRLVEQTPVVTYVASPGEGGGVLYVSPQIEALLGDPAQEDVVREPEAWIRAILPEDRGWVAAERARTRRTGVPLRAEYRLRARDGRVVWVREEATLVEGPGDKVSWQGVLVDITERKRAEERVAFLAYHDGLTGLPNRRMFDELAGLALARARRQGLAVALLYLDLDRFKEINDTCGHAAGDTVLQRFAARIRSGIREPDVMVRLGGDEFLVLLADLEPTPDPQDPDGAPQAQRIALAVARRIQELLARPFDVDGREIRVGASIGISAFPLWARDVKSLVKQADEAMYRSKRGPEGEHISLPARARAARGRGRSTRA